MAIKANFILVNFLTHNLQFSYLLRFINAFIKKLFNPHSGRWSSTDPEIRFLNVFEQVFIISKNPFYF